MTGSTPVPPTKFANEASKFVPSEARGIKICKMSNWTLYIVECKDGSLYTGITTNLEKRIRRHNEGRTTKYTRGRKPVKLVYSKFFDSESSARKKEIEIKKLSRKDKLKLITV